MSMDWTPSSSGACAADPGEGGSGLGAGSVDTKLQRAVQLKMEGNTFYREKNIKGAIKRYHNSLMLLRSLDSDVMAAVKVFAEVPALTASQDELLRSTQIDCYNNLAACLLQRQSVDYARVQEYSLRVLQWRPSDSKALYRAGVAALELGNAQLARQYLTQAGSSQPNDANVRRQLQRVEEKLNSEYQKEKAMYRGMFTSQGSGDGTIQASPK